MWVIVEWQEYEDWLMITIEVYGFGMDVAADHGSQASVPNGNCIRPVLPTFSKPNLQIPTPSPFRHPSKTKTTLLSTQTHA